MGCSLDGSSEGSRVRVPQVLLSTSAAPHDTPALSSPIAESTVGLAVPGSKA